jgi:hypothetical protein
MSDSIFLVSDDGSLTEAHSAVYQAEADLQELLADNIDLLPEPRSTRTAPAAGY